MISAKEARERAKEINKKALDTSIQEIENAISKAADLGDFYITVEHLLPQVSEILTSLGYSVTFNDWGRGDDDWTISWEAD